MTAPLASTIVYLNQTISRNTVCLTGIRSTFQFRLPCLGGKTCSSTTQMYDMKNSICLKAYYGCFKILFRYMSWWQSDLWSKLVPFVSLTLHLKLAIRNWVPAEVLPYWNLPGASDETWVFWVGWQTKIQKIGRHLNGTDDFDLNNMNIFRILHHSLLFFASSQFPVPAIQAQSAACHMIRQGILQRSKGSFWQLGALGRVSR